MEKTLPEGQFNNVVRWAKTADAERLKQLKVVLDRHVARLGAARKLRRGAASLVVAGIPDGSDQFDSGSLDEWAGRVEVKDKGAVGQILKLAATVAARMEG